jgi:hypothetical protein
MAAIYPLFYPGGETGWEDKNILLEDPTAVRFPRKKRESIQSVKKQVCAVEDEVTPEEQKRENERKRYHNMGGLSRNEKIIKIIESRKQRNIENQGMICYLYKS